MPALSEVIEMLSQFGFQEEHVRQALARGNSAFNAFEGLKLILTTRWAEMCQELSVERQRELRPIYDRLQAITMTARVTEAQKQVHEQRRVNNLFDDFMDRAAEHKMRVGRQFFETVREELRKSKRAGKLGADGERRAREAGIFGEDEEI